MLYCEWRREDKHGKGHTLDYKNDGGIGRMRVVRRLLGIGGLGKTIE